MPVRAHGIIGAAEGVVEIVRRGSDVHDAHVAVVRVQHRRGREQGHEVGRE